MLVINKIVLKWYIDKKVDIDNTLFKNLELDKISIHTIINLNSKIKLINQNDTEILKDVRKIDKYKSIYEYLIKVLNPINYGNKKDRRYYNYLKWLNRLEINLKQ